MFRNSIYRFIFLLPFVGFPGLSQAQNEYIKLNAAIHCDTQISGGKYSPEELAVFFEEQNLDVAFITDHDHVSAEYGFFPFRNVFKYRHHRPSIYTYGEGNYFNKINSINKQYPNIFVFPGIEAVPFYHWEGSLLQKNLRLKNWHRHLLVLGLNRAEDIEVLPSLINKQYSRYSALKILAGIISFLGLIYCVLTYLKILNTRKSPNSVQPNLHMVKNRTEKTVITKNGHVIEQMQNVLPYSYKISNYPSLKKQGNRGKKTLLIIGFFVCVLVIINSYPFKVQKYSQYDIDYGAQPYQDLIDYVNKKNGLIFWAHPEATFQSNVWKIEMDTPAYPELLLQTFNYTGFAIFWEGMKKVGCPGGIWDMVLNQYCTGHREKPVWAIGELDFEDSKDPKLLREALTPLWVQNKSEVAILNALKKGRMYATRNFAGDFIQVEKFSIGDKGRSAFAISGEKLVFQIAPTMNISFTISQNGAYRLELIRNGDIIQNFERSESGEWRIQFSDNEVPLKRKSYYRFLLYRNNWPVLASNPIFVEKEK